MSAKIYYSDQCPDCKRVAPTCGFYAQRSKSGGRCKDCISRRHKKWYAEAGRDYFLGLAFNLTEADYLRMWKEQDGRCALCHKLETAVDARTGCVRRLSIDHDHATDKIRQLLCRACNQGLGSFRDDPALMRRAAEYIERHQ